MKKEDNLSQHNCYPSQIGEAKNDPRSVAETLISKENLNYDIVNKLSLEEIHMVIHELRVHQIELEMQNEDLIRIQLELDHAKARYYDIYDLAPEGYLIISEKGFILESNLTAAMMFGQTRIKLIKQQLTHFLYKEDQDNYFIHRNNLFKTLKPEECELRIIRNDGTALWVHMKATVVTEEGLPVCRMIISDVSARKEAELVAMKSEQRYRDYLENAPDGVFVTDEMGQFIEANRAFSEITGYIKDELLRMTIGDILAPESLEDGLNHLKSLLETAKLSNSLQYKQKDGSNRWWTVDAVKLDNHRYLVFCKDITEKKIANDALRLKNLVFDASIAANSIADVTGVITEVNDAFLRMWGYPGKNEVVGKSLLQFFNDPNETVGIFAALNGTGHWEGEFSAVRSDESIFLAHGTANALIDEHGSLQGYHTQILDISKQRQAEDMLQQSEAKLSSILSNLQDVVWSLTWPDLRPIFISESVESLYGRPAQDFSTNPALWQETVHPEDRQYNEMALRTLQERGCAERTCRIVRPDGSIVWIRDRSWMVFDKSGRPLRVDGIVSDVTERKHTEKRMKFEAERYNALIESTNDWIWVVDSENYTLTLFNTAVANYFRKNYNIILKSGMTLEEMLSEKSNRRNLWKSLYKKAVSEGIFSIEYQTAMEDLHFIVSLAPLVIDDETVGISVFAKNITKEYGYKAKLEISNQVLSKRLKQTITAISKIGEMRDAYTAGHQTRVADLACAIAQEMGLSNETINNISDGALIHDIGKIYIASGILNKPSKITSLEFQLLQTHVDKSYDIVKDIDFPTTVIEMIHQHHERMDGTGYPKKLAGDQIIIEGRILAVSDVVEAMSAHRPYRPALGIDKALEEILIFRDIKYDGDVVDACVRLFREKSFEFKNDNYKYD